MAGFFWFTDSQWARIEPLLPVAAVAIDQILSERARNLLDFPEMGRPGMLADTRELTVHPNYRLVYELVGDDVHILNVVHARRDWPEG